jgi:hypothetical protein
MLDANKDIDQLFRKKLGDFEKTPPNLLWANIQTRLDQKQNGLRLTMVKTVGIAAAILLAFLAGWWMTNPTNKGTIPQNSVAIQNKINPNIDAPTNKASETIEMLSVNANPVAPAISKSSQKVDKTSSSNLSTLATFAANTTFINKLNDKVEPKTSELELFNSEKEFLSILQSKFKLAKRLTDWITTSKNDSTITVGSNIKSLNIKPFNDVSTGEITSITYNNPAKNTSGRWSLKAEIAPVFNSQPQNNRQGSSLFSDSRNYLSQRTRASNTVSAGMMAGYKVGKYLVVKSGLVYNKIHQTTSHVNLMGAIPTSYILGYEINAITPSGQVTLTRKGNSGINADPIFNKLSGISTSYSFNGELSQNIEFIEIPLQATYKLISKKVNVGLTGGISTNILIGNKANLSDNGTGIGSGETGSMRHIVYSSAVGVEIGYEITNRIVITVEPRLKRYMNSLSSNKSVNFKPSQMEVVTGLSYSFN